MTDTASILLSLAAVFWVLVRAVVMDALHPWIERLPARARGGPRERPTEAVPWEARQ
jgi:hypothetical protein